MLKLKQNIVRIEAKHNGRGKESKIGQSNSRVMLRANLWVESGLVNSDIFN